MPALMIDSQSGYHLLLQQIKDILEGGDVVHLDSLLQSIEQSLCWADAYVGGYKYLFNIAPNVV